MKLRKSKFIIVLLIAAFFLATFAFFFVGAPPKAKNVSFGVVFSQKQAGELGLDWKENYIAILDDLRVRNLKLIAYWDLVEPEDDGFKFEDVDFQVREAEKRNAEILFVVGMKTPRWPECHIPSWAKSKTDEERNEKLLDYLEVVVNRYKDSSAVTAWQIENEPFFPFGDCPEIKESTVKKEISLVRSLDAKPIVITDSGEGSFWFRAANLGDVVGTTMYRIVWMNFFNRYFEHFITETFYWRKAQLVETFFKKKVIVVELQAEPWGPKSIAEMTLDEQKQSMDIERFKEHINFANNTGFDKFYLWGAEWWYLVKTKYGDDSIWNEAQKLF